MTDLLDPPGARRRRQLIQQWGTILWPSFVVAGLACMLFFAFVDPLQLRDISFPGHALSRELGYTLGFFMFWAVTAAASCITGYLLRPLRRDDDDVPLG